MRKGTLALLGLLLIVTGATIVASNVRTASAAGFWAVSLDANSTTATDVVIQASNTPVKTFNVGAIVNASSTNPLTNVFGWQFSITYDNTTLVPQGDPSLTSSYPDGAGNTVQFGAQTALGNPNWAGKVGANVAFGSSTIIDLDATHRKILVFFTLLSPSGPVNISPTITGNLLANVAFEIVNKPSSSTMLTLGDVQFVDPNAGSIPNVSAGPSISETIGNSPPVSRFTTAPIPNGDASCMPITGLNCSPYAFGFDGTASSDVDGTIANPTGYFWDFGDGIQDLATQGQIAIHDYGLPGKFNVTLRVVDNLGATGSARDSLGGVIVNNQPSHIFHPVLADLAPTAIFTESLTTASTGTTITFDASASSDSDGTIASYAWNFGDASTAAGVTASHSYVNPGTFTVTLTVTDNLGVTAATTSTKIITPANVPPVARFTESATSALTGTEISLDASTSSDSDGTIVSYAWNFGDGTFGTGVTATHSYAVAGSYTVTLTVTDDSGATNILSAFKTIADRPPTVSFTEDKTTAFRGETITLSIAANDPDGTIIKTVVFWGDGTIDEFSGPVTTGSHSYASAGVYQVNVTAQDNSGLVSNHALADKTIQDQPPHASFTETATTAPVGTSISFDASASSDPDGTIASYSWNFGDGSPVGAGVNPSHAYTAAGPYTVTLTVTDDAGSVNQATANKIITPAVNVPPVASFTESATNPLTGVSISFDASASSDPDGGTIVTYAWDFGDGATSSGVTVTHAYNIASSVGYTVTLTVTDSDGGATGTSSATKTIQDRAPVASFTESTTSPTASFSVHFDASGSIDPDGAIASYSWNFGDGSPNGIVPIIDHIYSSPGAFTVTLTVTDDAGLTATSSAVKTVIADLPPTVTFTEDKSSALTGQAITLTITSSDVDGTVTSTRVDWGDGAIDNLPGAALGDSHFYGKAGSYTVTVTVTDDAGLTDSLQASKTIIDRPPVARFIESATSPLTGVSISFDASASADPDGTITNYAWDFGDGSSGSGVAASHSYVKAGPYTVTLTVTDDNGSFDTSTATKNIGDRAPTASFTESTSATSPNTPIHFDASASTDPDGTVNIYSWDFGDSSTATGATVDHSYAGTGTFTVTLTVTDDTGLTGTSSADKTISANAAPTVSFTEDKTGAFRGETITLTISAADSDGSVASITVNWGDGTIDNLPGSAASDTHSYSNLGGFTVTVTATDNLGATASQIASKTIENQAPVASFTESSSGAPVNVPISFDAAASSDFDGTITTYTWDFGDGTSGTGQTTSHSYLTAGSFTVILTVTDNDGSTAHASATKTITSVQPVALFTESATSAKAGDTIRFDGSASYDTDGTVVSYAWDFGDGTTGTGVAVDHAYSGIGTFSVSLTVTDNSGLTGMSSADKIISPSTPAGLNFTEDKTAALTGQTITLTILASNPSGTVDAISVDWGDGTVNNLPGSATSDSHSYATSGPYTVKVTATLSDGSVLTSSAAKTIMDRPPVAKFTVSSTTVVQGTPVSFDASASFDPDGRVAGYVWDFGDGKTGIGVAIIHTYNVTGTYTVTLLVTDDSASTGTASQAVLVTKPAPKIILTFQAYDADDFDNGVGELNVTLNGQLVVNTPAGLFHLTGTGSYAPLDEVWANLGPFDVTGFTVQGTNTLVFSNPLTSHSVEIRNVLIVLNDPVVLLDYRQTREVTPTQSLTLTFSNPPVQITSFTVSPSPVFVTEQRTFTATYTGGVGPFKCTFNFGDGGAAVASSTTQSCSVVHTYWLGTADSGFDAGGNFTAAVKVQGATTGAAVATMPLEVLRQPKFTGSGLTFASTITTPNENFSAQVTNPTRVDLLVRIDFLFYPPADAPTTRFISPSFLIPGGQTSTFSFTFTTTAHGFYYFQAKLTYGADLNNDGTLQDSEVLGDKAPLNGHFLAS